ncbi:MAG: hypothetical protein JNL70_26630 [Saprospiraceae bacterium]|nr:hypothetical protein [Saprospiraceae bacterium]
MPTLIYIHPHTRKESLHVLGVLFHVCLILCPVSIHPFLPPSVNFRLIPFRNRAKKETAHRNNLSKARYLFFRSEAPSFRSDDSTFRSDDSTFRSDDLTFRSDD